MDQKTLASNIMEAFQKLNPQGQNAVLRNLYEVAQKSRAQEVLDLENKLSDLKKSVSDMDAIFTTPLPLSEREVKYWQKDTAKFPNGVQSLFFGAMLQDARTPLGPPDHAFEATGVKSDNLDDCRH